VQTEQNLSIILCFCEGRPCYTNFEISAPTVYHNVTLEDCAMQSEMFGPILPVITVSDHKEAINIIQSLEKPLALYIFSKSNEVCTLFNL